MSDTNAERLKRKMKRYREMYPIAPRLRALEEVLFLIADEQRRATEPAAVGALANVRNAINAMMEEPTP